MNINKSDIKILIPQEELEAKIREMEAKGTRVTSCILFVYSRAELIS